MLVGICKLKILIYEANSLKEKRSVVKSIIRRLGSRYNISISEVGMYDMWNQSEIGFAVVSNDTKHIEEVISKTIGFLDKDHRIEIIEEEKEIL